MLKEWQFNVLFFVGVGGAILILVGPEFGWDLIGKNPMAATGVSAILAYVLAQKKSLTRKENPPPKKEKPPEEVEADGESR